MNQLNNTTTKQKYKHITDKNLDKIIQEYVGFMKSVQTEFRCNNKNHHLKVPKRNINKTQFMKRLSRKYNTSLSNIYKIIKQATTTVLDGYLKEKTETSFYTLKSKRLKRKPSNNSKLMKAKPFIDKVIEIVKNNKLDSIDETINYFKRHKKDEIEGLTTICTSTMYNYVKADLIALKPIDLPRMLRRKAKKNYKTYTNKKCRGTSIDLRPEIVNSRSEFGHWEGDLVTGPRDGINGAFLTLLERKTRFYYMIRIKDKKSKTVYMAINKLAKLFGDDFKRIFKTITFDNGSEFSRFKDLEERHKINIYFAHPYCSYERGSNENANQLIRYYVTKGTDINTLEKDFIESVQRNINNKKRKILGYLPAESLFKNELNLIKTQEINRIYL